VAGHRLYTPAIGGRLPQGAGSIPAGRTTTREASMISRLYEYDLFGRTMHMVEIPCIYNNPRLSRYDVDTRERDVREQYLHENCPNRYSTKLLEHDGHAGTKDHSYWSVLFFSADDALLFYLRWGQIGEP
jgi:hypothetical protein